MEELFSYASTCPYRYKRYRIKKRNGHGYREIAQPSRDLKAVQYTLLGEFFTQKLTQHNCATAYKSGASILKNAEPHLNNKYFLKMDFRDFFPSIKDSDFDSYLVKKGILEDEVERSIVTKIFFMKSGESRILSIGSLGSPTISNALLYDFDVDVYSRCRNAAVTYTRYSDDMIFSTNQRGLLFGWPNIVAEILDAMDFPRLTINQEKTVFSSMKFNRHVTGITISNEGKASLGRSKKREIRTRVYLVGRKTESEKELQKLRGYVAFARSIEPQFVSSLWKKYPEEMKQLLSVKSDIKNS